MEQQFNAYITGLQHLGIPTNNIEETIEFYKGLGFQIALQTLNEQANEKVAFMRLENITIETYENKNAVMTDGAINHIALNVTDIEKVFQMAKRQGYCLLEKSIQYLPFWQNGVKFFNIKGPNGEKIEFSQYL